MRILLVNACARGKASRTLSLASSFLSALQECCSDIQLLRHDLYEMKLQPIDEEMLNEREDICNRHDWKSSIVRAAVDFHQSDLVVIAAPYWDMSFPAILKTWVERIYVRNLNFRYENDRCIGLAQPKACVYLSTAGSPIGENDWGSGYIQAVMRSLGVREFIRITAEGLDLDGHDPEQLMKKAINEAQRAASQAVKLLTDAE